MQYTLTPLKDLLELFYIDEISKALEIDKSQIKYERNDQIITDAKDFASVLSKAERDKIFKKAEGRCTSLLDTFNCVRNRDVEDFLKERSIDFHKRNISKTFLYLDDNNNVAGYFALAVKTLYVREKISSRKRRLSNARPSKIEDCHATNTFLIGQIGRADGVSKSDINLDVIFKDIFAKLTEAKSIVGCSTILIEVDKEPKLIERYKAYDFEYLQEDKSGLSQLWYLSVDY